MKRILIFALLALAASSSSAFAQKQKQQSPAAPLTEEQFFQLSEEVVRLLRAGNEALIARRFDEALQYFEKGIKAAPGEPAFWVNKAITLVERGSTTYNAALFNSDEAAKKAGLEAARQDIRAAVPVANKALQVYNAHPPPSEDSPFNYAAAKTGVLRVRAYALWLLVMTVDPSYAPAALDAAHEYLAVETDAFQKLLVQLQTGRMMMVAQMDVKAFEEYQKALLVDPDNVEALLGAGLALVNFGDATNDKQKVQEGLDYLQRYVEKAPRGDRYRGSVETAINYLKSEAAVKETEPSNPATAGGGAVYGQREPAKGTPSSDTSKQPVEGGVLNGKALSLPPPPYPVFARLAHLRGTVVVNLTIDEEGNVMTARAVSGHPLLRAVCVEAAREAKFSPTLLSGLPVKVIGSISYNFVND